VRGQPQPQARGPVVVGLQQGLLHQARSRSLLLRVGRDASGGPQGLVRRRLWGRQQ
jgi:hypothetical protein